MKPDIICFPIIDWRFRYQRPQQILSRFARRGHRVFYVETTFAPASSFPLVPAEAERNLAVRPLAKNVWSVTLTSASSLNLYKDSITPGSVLSSLLRSLEVLWEKEKIGETLLFVHLPFWRPLVEAYRRRFGGAIVYDCMDNHRGFSTNTARMCDEEDALVEMADVVTVSADFLFRQFSHVDKKTLLVRNGTEFLHFHDSQPTPALAHLPHPIIGYYGAISEWFDTELIATAARQRPEWCFVLIGDTFGANLRSLQGLANVYLLGEKPYTELPGYLQCFDVSCIPFHLTELTRATDPVKFYEYLSAGKPVVATRLPELLPFSDALYFATGAEEFIEKIEQALRENTRDRVEQRIALARSHDWDTRVTAIEHKIAALQKKVSVIVLTYNNLAYTKLCLESLYSDATYENWELVIVDNCSTDETPSYLAEFAASHGNVRLILNRENLGFARGNNQGIAAASGDLIILLNNDVVVTKGWMGKMAAYLARPEVGLVGPVTNGTWNEAKVDLGYRDLSQLPQAALRYMEEHAGQCFESKVLAAFCLGMRRSLIEEVGLLDERFEVGMFEDDDYSRRVREKGYRVVCAQDIFIHHFGGASFYNLPKEEYLRIFQTNKVRYEEKWQETWERHEHNFVEANTRRSQKMGVNKQETIAPEYFPVLRETKFTERLHAVWSRLAWQLRRRLPQPMKAVLQMVLRRHQSAPPSDSAPQSGQAQWSARLAEIVDRHPEARDVVIFAPSVHWNLSLFQRPHQLALAFARIGCLVFFREPPTVTDFDAGFHEVAERLYIANVPLEAFARIDAPILLFLAYNVVDANFLHSPCYVYDYIDDLEVFFHAGRTMVEQNHQQMLKSATLVIGTAERLWREVAVVRPDAILCPNGADYDLIRRQIESTAKPPEDLRLHLRPTAPIIGYYGALAEWFDYDLLRHLARARPEYEFVLIGLDYDGSLPKSCVTEEPNIHWLGVRPYAQLFHYLKYFDVATIPFKLNNITHSTSPIKLFEYMAGGKPVVATAMAETRRYEGVLIAEHSQQFAEKVDEALTLRADADYLALIDRVARKNTWDSRAQQILDALAEKRSAHTADAGPMGDITEAGKVGVSADTSSHLGSITRNANTVSGRPLE